MLRYLLAAAILTVSGLVASEVSQDGVEGGSWRNMEEIYHNGMYIYTSRRSKRDVAERTPRTPLPRASVENADKCFQLTWISSEQNETSPDCFKTNKEGSPCFEPFVITADGSEPDMSKIEEALLALGVTNIYCRRQKNLCMRFTYYHNNDVPFNASWFCGRVDKKDGAAGTYGQYTEILSGSQKRTLNFCDGPLCNAAPIQLPSWLAVACSFMLLWVR